MRQIGMWCVLIAGCLLAVLGDVSANTMSSGDNASGQAVFNADAATQDLRLELRNGSLLISADDKIAVSYPVASISDLIIRGNDLDNTLTIDFAGGNPIPAGVLTFDGVNRGTDFDTLKIVNSQIVATLSDALNGHDGDLALSFADGSVSNIRYLNIEPIDMTGSSVTDIVLNLPTGPDNAELSDIGGGFLQIQSIGGAPTFESTVFNTPSASLTINGGVDDTFSMGSAVSIASALFVNIPMISVNEDLDAGSVSLVGDVVLNANLDFRIGGTTPGPGVSEYEQFVVSGAVSITGGSLSLTQGGGFIPGPNDSFVILDNDDVDAISGSFTGLPEGAVIPGGLGGTALNITYVGGDGNDIVLFSQADVSISKTDGVISAVPGQSLTYTIVASNAGPGDDPAVGVVDSFPAGLTCSTTSSVTTGSATGNTAGPFAGNIGDTLNMPAGSSVTYTAVCNIASDATGTLSNTATATASVIDPDDGNNSATDADTVLEAEADLSITKTDSPDPVLAGESLTYTITVNNAGPSDALAVVVTDTLPSGLTVTSTSGCAEDPNAVPTCSLGPIAAGQSAQYTISADVDASVIGDISNSASVASDTTDTEQGNNSITEVTAVLRAGIDIEKSTNGEDADSPTGPYILLGDAVEWIYTVTNTGNVPLDNIVVTDDILGTIGGCPSTSLDVGESMDCTTPDGVATPGQYMNQGGVIGTYITNNPSTGDGVDVTDDDPSHYYGIDPSIELKKYISVDSGVTYEDANVAPFPTAVAPHGALYRITVENTGLEDLENVVVTDPILGLTNNVGSLLKGQTVILDEGTVPAIPELSVEEVCSESGSFQNTAAANGNVVDLPDSTVFDDDPATLVCNAPAEAVPFLSNFGLLLLTSLLLLIGFRVRRAR